MLADASSRSAQAFPVYQDLSTSKESKGSYWTILVIDKDRSTGLDGERGNPCFLQSNVECSPCLPLIPLIPLIPGVRYPDRIPLLRR